MIQIFISPDSCASSAATAYSTAPQADQSAAIAPTQPAPDYRCSAAIRYFSSRRFSRSLPCSSIRKISVWASHRPAPSWRRTSSEHTSSATSRCRAKAPSSVAVERDVWQQPVVNLREIIFITFSRCAPSAVSFTFYIPRRSRVGRQLNVLRRRVVQAYDGEWWIVGEVNEDPRALQGDIKTGELNVKLKRCQS